MIPRDWVGDPAVVIASGPSLTQDDADYCRGRAWVIVVNDNYRRAPWADVLYAADAEWWRAHDGVMGFRGEKWCPDEATAKEFGCRPIDVRAPDKTGDVTNNAFSTDPAILHRMGGNSGGQALNMAILRGASPIYLLGFDMQPTGGRKHWFGDHPSSLRKSQNFDSWRRALDAAYPQAAALGVEIVNCSRETALTAYPRASIANCL
jgi:hypothetical protein